MRSLTCDICKKPTERIVFKLFLSPVTNGSTRATHSNYTGHADVGECCGPKLVKEISWQKRKTMPRKPKN